VQRNVAIAGPRSGQRIACMLVFLWARVRDVVTSPDKKLTMEAWLCLESGCLRILRSGAVRRPNSPLEDDCLQERMKQDVEEGTCGNCEE
jgi:hypothetical protein